MQNDKQNKNEMPIYLSPGERETCKTQAIKKMRCQLTSTRIAIIKMTDCNK